MAGATTGDARQTVALDRGLNDNRRCVANRLLSKSRFIFCGARVRGGRLRARSTPTELRPRPRWNSALASTPAFKILWVVAVARSVTDMRLFSRDRGQLSNLVRPCASALLVVVFASGCGHASSEQALREAWSARREAFRSLDSVALCNLLSQPSRDRVVAGFRRAGLDRAATCETGFNETFLVGAAHIQGLARASRLIEIEIRGSAAETLDLARGEQDRVRWVLERGAWRIDTRRP